MKVAVTQLIFFLHFNGSCANETVWHYGLPLGKSVHIGVQPSIKVRFENIFEEFLILDSASDDMMILSLKEILTFCSRYLNGNEFSKHPFKSIQHIKFHYTEDIKIETLARIEKMSLTKYRNLFKTHTGLSPLDYIISLRINTACRLLITTNLSVSEIASKVGYDDPYYFSRIFKTKMKIPPLGYRKNKTKNEKIT